MTDGWKFQMVALNLHITHLNNSLCPLEALGTGEGSYSFGCGLGNQSFFGEYIFNRTVKQVTLVLLGPDP